MTTSNFKLFISSYGLYNTCGGMAGKWYDISKYSDVESLEKDVKADLAARGDFDPEFMCLDYQNDSFKLYEEAGLGWVSDYFELMDSLGEDSDRMEAFGVFREYHGSSGFDSAAEALSKFEDRYHGSFDSETDFAEHLVEETTCENIPRFYLDHFNYESYAVDLFIDGYIFLNGYVFSRG